MKDQETVQKCIELRAQGVSFARIAELTRRDLASVPTARLQGMAEQLRRRLDRECGPTLFSTGVELSRDDETRPAVEGWHA